MSNPASTSKHSLLGLAGWLLATFATGAIGAFASANAGDFYTALERPAWAPPAWLFGPVWTMLYVLMGIAAWLVWRARGFAGAGAALVIFVIQLIVNALWTWLFFVWHRGALAFAEIMLLWLLIAANIILFSRTSRTAAALLLPYLAWVSFATTLTFAVWQRNHAILG